MAETLPEGADRKAKALLDALATQAVEDAHLVGQFLNERLEASAARTGLPIEFFLRLGMILRHAEWERVGIRAHERAGLGTADENWLGLLDEMESGQLEARSDQLLRRMIAVLYEHILWDSTDSTVRLRTGIGATISDDMLDELSAFLLTNSQGLME